ncbi:hypothetical protein Zmor_022547 [Zophobas morio]|uniref:Cell cycle checkpoint protein RAD17 n=1 Tax=Zophobas morio TaxID=2755281 RepID=A0AA38HXT4_9CUCU|nr:hypothetical protein Zmor_022547 [Zophobas morio]
MKKGAKKWLGLQFDFEENSKTIPSTNCTTVEVKKSKSDLSALKKRTFNFQLHLKPKIVTDLAVHSKKIGEVESWLQLNVINRPKNSVCNQTASFLLICGPTGSGKTATIQVLCKKLGIDISEWTNPVDQEFDFYRGVNQVTGFTEFLTESKWNSLFSVSDKKIILVEDFPNALVRKSEDFGAVLEECYYKGNYPIVFICTDSNDSKMNLSEKLFTQDLRNKYKIVEISFNACAMTLLRNALKRAHNLVQDNLDLFKTPSPETVNAIIATSMGDIKCAINQYYFASLLGTADLPTVSTKKPQKTGTKRKRTETSSSVQSMSRDQTLGLFHGVGKVLNPKRVETGGSWRLNCDLQKLIDEFSTQPTSFIAFLFENYVKYYGNLDDVCAAAEILSLSQTFLEKWVDRQDVLPFSLWVAVMGLMIHNEHRVMKWTPITGPKKTQKKVSERDVTDLYYRNIINNVENSRFDVTV